MKNLTSYILEALQDTFSGKDVKQISINKFPGLTDTVDVIFPNLKKYEGVNELSKSISSKIGYPRSIKFNDDKEKEALIDLLAIIFNTEGEWRTSDPENIQDIVSSVLYEYSDKKNIHKSFINIGYINRRKCWYLELETKHGLLFEIEFQF